MSKQKTAVLALIISNIIWGMASPIFKWSLAGIHPFTLAFLRFAIPIFLLLFLAPKSLKIKSKDFPLFFIAGFLGISINIGAFFLGIERTVSINSPIISSSGPVFVLLGSMFLLKEKPTKKMLLGNLIGLTGVLLIVFEPILHTKTSISVVGNLFLVLATFATVGGTLSVKKLASHYSAVTIVFWTFLIGTLSFTPSFLGELHVYGIDQLLNLKSIVGIIFGSIFSSFIAYGLYYWALKYIKASQTAVFTYTDPVIAVLVAAPLVHEYPDVFFFMGSFLVFFGIFVAEGRLHYHPVHLFFRKN